MQRFVEWEYYCSLYNKVSETDFNKSEDLAEKEVAVVVGLINYSHISNDDFCVPQLKDCICKTMDMMAEQAESAIGKGVASVSNDGYTESYVIQTPEQATAELRKSIRSWLSGSGLVRAY